MGRELWETVEELITALATPGETARGLTVTGMTVDLPVELAVVRTAVGFRLLVDAPHFRWDGGLRPRPGRVQLSVRRATEDDQLQLEVDGPKTVA